MFDGQRNGSLIDASIAEEVLNQWDDRITRAQVGKLLRVNVQVLDELEKAGFLKRYTLGSLKRSFFRKSEIHSFLSRLADQGKHDPRGAEMVPLHATRFGYCRILGGVLSGDVRAGISSNLDEFDLTKLYVNRTDCSIPDYVKPVGTQTTGYVQTKLRLSARLLRKLRDHKVIESVTVSDVNGSERLLYLNSSIEDFCKRFVSVYWLCRTRADLPRVERRLLGVTPVYDFGGVDRVFRREDIPR
jgi:hypothetical protein